VITPDLPLNHKELVQATAVRFVMFGRYWGAGLDRKPFGRAHYNAWTDACFHTLDPSPAQLRDISPLLKVLERMDTIIHASLGGAGAILPMDFELAVTALPPNWIIWEDLPATHDHIATHLFKGIMMPFADDVYYKFNEGA